ncbi:hypothetical protein BTE77_01010 [Ensifer adhaerens]|nr:hypothetical protein BTE77_01010 [Ensifer adhaerens]
MSISLILFLEPRRMVGLPLTLALSPLTGRGDLFASRSPPLRREGPEGAAYPFTPPAGRRWRQPDEGLPHRADEGHAP